MCVNILREEIECALFDKVQRERVDAPTLSPVSIWRAADVFVVVNLTLGASSGREKRQRGRLSVYMRTRRTARMYGLSSPD